MSGKDVMISVYTIGDDGGGERQDSARPLEQGHAEFR